MTDISVAASMTAACFVLGLLAFFKSGVPNDGDHQASGVRSLAMAAMQ
jgi:hypothetical protein